MRKIFTPQSVFSFFIYFFMVSVLPSCAALPPVNCMDKLQDESQIWEACIETEECVLVTGKCGSLISVNQAFVDEAGAYYSCVAASVACETVSAQDPSLFKAECNISTCVVAPAVRVRMTREVCESEGGRWDDEDGRGHSFGCTMPTTDAGKECGDSKECEGVCVADYVTEKGGRCSDTDRYKGCRILMDGETICMD